MTIKSIESINNQSYKNLQKILVNGGSPPHQTAELLNSGVNLDEEAANLLKYQQLYSASTKVLQTGNQMFNSLLMIMN